MADKLPMLPPASEPFPGSRTPGWNDPPTLQYNPLAASSSSGKTRLNLNKRVAFPLQGTAGALSNSPKPTAVVPPTQTSILPPPPPVATINPMNMSTNVLGAASYQPVALVHPITHTDIMRAEIQQNTLTALRQQLRLVPEDIANKREEIERRLGIIEQLWQSNILSREVQTKLYHLSKAIVEQNFNAAMESYTSLATNHSNECASWSVALRHIVLTIQPNANNTIQGNLGASAAPVLNVPANTTEPMDISDVTNISAVRHI